MPRILILSNPRCGNHYLSELLNSHPDFYINADEILKGRIEEDPFVHIDNILKTSAKHFIGFNCFPEHLSSKNIKVREIVDHIGANFIIVLWRESILETLASLKIAENTGVWYNAKKSTYVEKVAMSPSDIQEFYLRKLSEWKKMAEEWPINGSSGVVTIFIRYEDLLANPSNETERILSNLSWTMKKSKLYAQCQKQNPATLQKKITNWNEIPGQLKELKIDVPKILVLENLAIPASPFASEILEFGPDKEPLMPPTGWHYRVASPWMPAQLKQNVFDAITSTHISSAGYWAQELNKKLKKLFHVPVSQPCSNGFSALLLAMQTAQIGTGDEVIMPSFTMIADPNAVHFLGATPIFADCSPENYNPDWTEIKKVASAKTKAVIVTHTYGVPTPNMRQIADECKQCGWILIEDISQCVGVKVIDIKTKTDKLLGTFGDFACASMYVNKLIHAGDGGFVIAKEPKHAKTLLSIVNHGFTPFYHFVHFHPATNSKINGLGAAMACGCIDELDTIMTHRNSVAKTYRELLKLVPLETMPLCGPYDTPWVFGLVCKTKQERTLLRKFLAEHGVETRDYFFALHLQPAYKLITNGQRLPRAEKLGSTGFYLPTHTNLSFKDIQYICSIVNVFFQTIDYPSIDHIKVPQLPQSLAAVQVSQKDYSIEVREFDRSGELTRSEKFGHPYIEAVKLGLDAQECLIHEKWDLRESFIRRAEDCIQKGKDDSFEKFLSPFVSYFKSISYFEPQEKPWLKLDMMSHEPYKTALEIPTTTDRETLNVLVWIVEQSKPKIVWEIGTWFGCATALIAAAGKKVGCLENIFACDAFLWQKWMDNYVDENLSMSPGQSFSKYFHINTRAYAGIITAVDWSYDITELPKILQNQSPDLIFLDITQNDEEFEDIWNLIFPELVPNKTIMVVNGLCSASIPFFTRHASQLKSIAKPATIAKVFMFIGNESTPIIQTEKVDVERDLNQILSRKLNFQSDPCWEHHHNDLFRSSIQFLREKFHDNRAPVLFTPAVEEKLCDEPLLYVKNPWVGIIHSVPDYPEYFYPPDLRRLCSSSYAKVMKNCKGLFTLTKFQAEYLKKNLPKEYSIPIQPLVYPILDNQITMFSDSNILTKWNNGEILDLVMIGSFARNYDYFFLASVPDNVQKVLLASDEFSQNAVKKCPSGIKILARLNGIEYESILQNSIPFISLKYEGAANTLSVECIQRNIPIVVPFMESCIEYFGPKYPLFYDPKNLSLEKIITYENITAGINYLREMDKSKFSLEKFVESVENGAVLLSIPPMPRCESDAVLSMFPNPVNNFNTFDVTICICSYKRTHNLEKILKSLWNEQEYKGQIEIIVWNNNRMRTTIVEEICEKYLNESNDHSKSFELINSTSNHFCSVRFAMPALMRSNVLLICDDDVFPKQNFISFFMSAHTKHPKDILCVRGHEFFPHELNLQEPTKTWHDYDNLKFYSDEDPEKFIHFVHADACIIPKKALQEMNTIEMPSLSFVLVDDYWMSFVLSHYFRRKLRKLCINNESKGEIPLERSDDSDVIDLAMYTRPEVQDARIQLYIHHMLQGWPFIGVNVEIHQPILDGTQLKSMKEGFWTKPHVGFNISHRIDNAGIQSLVKTGVDCVRIGAVGVGRIIEYELSRLLEDLDDQLLVLLNVVNNLGQNGISVVLTLVRSLVSKEIWKSIADKFANCPYMVGYDLINEPFTPSEDELHWKEISHKNEQEILKLQTEYTELIQVIRDVDSGTPIIIESSFWGHVDALDKIPVSELLAIDPGLIFSFHFYEPKLLTQSLQNKMRYKFPGVIPIYNDVEYGETIDWTAEYISKKLGDAVGWAKKHKVQLFIGEFGICRNIQGGNEYLGAIFNTMKDLKLTGFLFSFRDDDWDAMDYELGNDLIDMNVERKWENNPLMETILAGISAMHKQ